MWTPPWKSRSLGAAGPSGLRIDRRKCETFKSQFDNEATTKMCAVLDGREVGQISFWRTDHSMKVDGVEVAPDAQRQRIATRLYEEAAKFACSKGKPLESDSIRKRNAEEFWRKQWRKGRARAIVRDEDDREDYAARGGDPDNADPNKDPGAIDYLLSCPAPDSLEGMRRR